MGIGDQYLVSRHIGDLRDLSDDRIGLLIGQHDEVKLHSDKAPLAVTD